MFANIKLIETKMINPELFKSFIRGFVFTDDTIPEFTFEVLRKPEIDNRGYLRVATNLTWSVDLLKNSINEYKQITSDGEFTEDRELSLVMPLGDLGYNNSYELSVSSQAIYDQVMRVFAVGKKITLKNLSLEPSNKFGRIQIGFLFDKIFCDDQDVSGFLGERLTNYFKYQAYEDGFNYIHSMGLANLIYSLGAKVNYVTEEEIKARRERLEASDAEQKVQEAIKLAKAITPEKQAEIIKLRDEVGLSFAKIAVHFGVHKTTIISHYHKCKAQEATKLNGVK